MMVLNGSEVMGDIHAHSSPPESTVLPQILGVARILFHGRIEMIPREMDVPSGSLLEFLLVRQVHYLVVDS